MCGAAEGADCGQAKVARTRFCVSCSCNSCKRGGSVRGSGGGLTGGLGRKKLQESVFVFLAVGTLFWCSCNFCPKRGLGLRRLRAGRGRSGVQDLRPYRKGRLRIGQEKVAKTPSSFSPSHVFGQKLQEYENSIPTARNQNAFLQLLALGNAQ